jgi:hypothetical protein
MWAVLSLTVTSAAGDFEAFACEGEEQREGAPGDGGEVAEEGVPGFELRGVGNSTLALFLSSHGRRTMQMATPPLVTWCNDRYGTLT